MSLRMNVWIAPNCPGSSDGTPLKSVAITSVLFCTLVPQYALRAADHRDARRADGDDRAPKRLLTKRAGVLLQQLPAFRAELFLPLRVIARGLELVAEQINLHLVELKILLR